MQYMESLSNMNFELEASEEELTPKTIEAIE